MPSLLPEISDTALHYLLVSAGVGFGSLVKSGFDRLATKFWDKEAQEFASWKKEQAKKQ